MISAPRLNSRETRLPPTSVNWKIVLKEGGRPDSPNTALSTTKILPPASPLLNLLLSMPVAVQAPIISLMPRNRQAEKDRLHPEHDYEVNSQHLSGYHPARRLRL
ncbi:MAG: DUF1003 domain-containing protein [Desulfobulbia bacterium]